MKSSSILVLLVLVAVWFVVMILPQRNQQKKRSAMMKQMGPGAKILTAGGIYGRVIAVEGDTLRVEVAPQVQLDFDQRSVIRVVDAAPSAEVAQ